MAVDKMQTKDAQEVVSKERYKLVVLGDEGCGKTALLNALVKTSNFEVEDSHLSSFDECVQDIDTSENHIEFTLYEITGMDDYSSFRYELYEGTDVFLVCFDIGSPSSLESVITKWSNEIKQEHPHIPFLLIGCKNDLRTESALENKDCQDSVSKIKAESVSKRIRARSYVECCAKTRWNVNLVFQAAADAIFEEDTDYFPDFNEPVFRRRLGSDKSTSNLRRFSIVFGSSFD
ncbi:ras-like GTP-binding protein RHO [Xenia sp. Carnegie-2017]|uniref:ras-like GTP-binding protein RHO n=1 Tax=Xenia sp. Carnegie-2017 TaxID=2897299 RepID=UPI001F0471D1|nr:ras-like GTP-binding protein RHO [Xenia sp. Carnegie-2017]